MNLSSDGMAVTFITILLVFEGVGVSLEPSPNVYENGVTRFIAGLEESVC